MNVSKRGEVKFEGFYRPVDKIGVEPLSSLTGLEVLYTGDMELPMVTGFDVIENIYAVCKGERTCHNDTFAKLLAFAEIRKVDTYIESLDKRKLYTARTEFDDEPLEKHVQPTTSVLLSALTCGKIHVKDEVVEAYGMECEEPEGEYVNELPADRYQPRKSAPKLHGFKPIRKTGIEKRDLSKSIPLPEAFEETKEDAIEYVVFEKANKRAYYIPQTTPAIRGQNFRINEYEIIREIARHACGKDEPDWTLYLEGRLFKTAFRDRVRGKKTSSFAPIGGTLEVRKADEKARIDMCAHYAIGILHNVDDVRIKALKFSNAKPVCS